MTNARRWAQYLAGRPFGPIQTVALTAGRLCAKPVPMGDPATMPGWSGWGNSLENTRFQDQARGGLTAADLPRLKLKWAFGFANVPAARTQPAVAGGRLFVASDNGAVYALDPATGCTYWMFKAAAGRADGAVGCAVSHRIGHQGLRGAVR